MSYNLLLEHSLYEVLQYFDINMESAYVCSIYIGKFMSAFYSRIVSTSPPCMLKFPISSLCYEVMTVIKGFSVSCILGYSIICSVCLIM